MTPLPTKVPTHKSNELTAKSRKIRWLRSYVGKLGLSDFQIRHEGIRMADSSDDLVMLTVNSSVRRFTDDLLRTLVVNPDHYIIIQGDPESVPTPTN